MNKYALLFLAFIPLVAFSQKPVQLSFSGNSYQQLKKNIKTQYKDSAALLTYLEELQNYAWKKGYLLASVDSVVAVNKNHYRATFYLGKKLNQIALHIPEEEQLFIRKNARLSEKAIAKISLTPLEYSRLMQSLKNVYLDNGYPFVQLQLDSVQIHTQKIQANLLVHRGQNIQWRKIHIKGDSSISSKYVSNLIGIQMDDIYQENKLSTITQQIAQVNFIKELKPHELLFTEDGAELFLYLESVPVSSANGIVGLQPDPVSGDINLTGEISLRLQNLLKRGELLDLEWQSIQPQTQELDVEASYPFLFKTRFGIDGLFHLYKKDSTFLELQSRIGINYMLSGGSYLKAFYQNNRSSLLSAADNVQNSALNFAHISSNNYGLAFYRSRLNYLPNPSKGMIINVETKIGQRNAQLNDTSKVEQEIVFSGKLNLQAYIPIFKRQTIVLQSNTEFYYAPEIYTNEQLRFGGLNSQRGFNEQELLATTLSTFTLEYRFLVDKNSHAFAFFDQTWYENIIQNYFSDTPYGFGLGFSFGTDLGIFSISYALGKQQNNPILFRNGKIHFGYIAYF